MKEITWWESRVHGEMDGLEVNCYRFLVIYVRVSTSEEGENMSYSCPSTAAIAISEKSTYFVVPKMGL